MFKIRTNLYAEDDNEVESLNEFHMIRFAKGYNVYSRFVRGVRKSKIKECLRQSNFLHIIGLHLLAAS